MIKIGVVKGLKSINAVIDAEEAKFNGGEKTRWFKLNDKQSVKVVFLQELDEDSENYSQKNDVGFLAVEHSNPDNFRNKALCTIDDEGECFGCEKHQEDFKAGWKQKHRFYINVLVDNGTDDPYVAVLSQGNSAKSITPALIEQATELGTVTDRWFKIKRNGAGFNDTSYVLTPLKEHGLNVEDYELYDLNEKVVRHVPYAEQEAHYYANTEPKEQSVEATPADTDSDTW